MDRRYDLVLLLTLAATVLLGHSGKASVVGTAPNVQGWKGENIRLPCGIKEKPLTVVWVQERISEEQQRTIKAEFVNGDFRSREERFDMDKNFSLVITDLEVADEGHYYCQVVLKNFENFDNSSLLTISAMTSRHTIDECDDNSQSHHSRCTYQSPSNNPSFTLTCVVSGFKPNISMLWTEESGERLNSVDSQQNTLFDGTYERFETITVSAKHGTEQTFMCVATGDSLNGTSTREITILPIHISGKRAHLALIIGLAIGLPAALIIVFLFVGKYLQNKHPDYLPRKGCGWNPCWRRPNKPERFHDEEELMLRSSSLTNEQVQKCKEELKAYYCLSRRKVTVEPLNFMERVELDDIYTNLSIIDRTSKGNTKTTITYGDLVANDEHGHLSKRLLIQGEGGVGKTTLCSKIAWDWCQGRILQDLDMVLLIPLRDVNNKRSIGGIAKTYLSDSNPAKSYQIDDYISRNQSRIVIIFDGFDEFNGTLSGIDSSEYDKVKSECLSRRQEFRYLLYFTSALENELGLDIIHGLIDSAPHVAKDRTPEAYQMESDDRRYRDFCVDVAFECHTEEAARTPSLEIDSVKCGRTVSRDLAEGMCSRSVLSKVEIFDSQFHVDFYNILGAEASNCEIQDLMLHYNSDDHDSWHQTSTGSDLARCVCTMPRLLKFRLGCPYLPDSFLSTAAASASSCQIQDLVLDFEIIQDDSHYQSSMGDDLARWVFDMPRLSSFSLACPYLPDGFLSTAVTSASSCQIQDLELYLSKEQQDLKHQSSGGADLARWVCTMPSLLKFKLSWLYLPDGFLSTAIALVSSCQIRDLVFDLRRYIGDCQSHDDSQYQSSLGGDLVRCVCALPSLTKFSLRCPYLTDDFLSAAAASASSCQFSHIKE
ncbi:uncharacterized protein [Diadema antillarum]|uniref:uncharacterized protein n=1 Tax=Diadema antillarum TaxID=105358 RepID=UPI003A8A81AB